VQDNLGDSATQALSITVDTAPLNIVITADNVDEVYVNGNLLGGSTVWQLASNYKVPLQSGVNVIAVKATDTDASVGGLIAELAWGGNTAVSDSTWKASTVLEAGWELPGFDDSAWPAANSYGVYGVAPWLQSVRLFPVGSSAEWIWSADNVTDDVVYFRYTITVP
jgi:alpha-L-rhamnosidase